MADANPFPGPQPYRAEDRARFFGREELAQDLVDAVLSHRVLTVFGPSGAGKSSLLQAAVLPTLIEDEGVRCVTVDSWPERIVAAEGPVSRLTEAIGRTLELGPLRPDDLASAVELAFLISERPLVILLDQIEQLLVPHEPAVLEALVVRLAELASWRGGSVHVLTTLREDYLGRWSALMARRPRLIRHTFRVRRLTAPEVSQAVLRAAATAPVPQHWEPAALAPYIEEMELPGEWRADGAEVETAYVQIVARQLFARGGPGGDGDSAAAILEHYLGDTLRSLGPLQEATRTLLAAHFVHGDSGRRVQVSREEVRLVVGAEADAAHILATLEQARILRARQHQGAQLFELGHDWLARPVREEVARQRAAEADRQRRRRWRLVAAALTVSGVLVVAFALLFAQARLALAEAERQRVLAETAEERAEAERDRAVAEREAADRARQEADAARRTAEAAEQRSRSAEVLEAAAKREALAALDAAERAQRGLERALAAAEAAERAQARRAREARDGQRMLAVRELQGQPHRAAPFLVDIAPASGVSGWRGAVWRLLQHPLAAPRPAVGRPARPARLVVGEHGAVLLAQDDGGVSVLDGNGPGWDGAPVEALAAAEGLAAAVVVADGRRWLELRDAATGARRHRVDLGPRPITALVARGPGRGLAAAGMDGRLHLVDAAGGHRARSVGERTLGALAAHPQDGRLATVATDGTVQLWSAEGEPQQSVRLDVHALAVAWLDEQTVVVGGAGGALHRWRPGRAPASSPVLHGTFVHQLLPRPGHAGELLSLDQKGGLRLVRWGDGAPELRPLRGAEAVRAARWSPDGGWLVTVGEGGQAVMWSLTADGHPLRRWALLGHPRDEAVVGGAFSVDSARVLTVDAGGGVLAWSTGQAPVAEVVVAPGARPLQALALSEDGATVWGDDGSGWRRLQGSGPRGTGAARSADGRVVAQLGPAGEVEVVVDGVHRLRLVEPAARAERVAVAANGGAVVLAAADGSVWRWRLQGDAALLAAVQALPRRCMLAADRVRFFGELPGEAEAAAAACQAGDAPPP